MKNRSDMETNVVAELLKEALIRPCKIIQSDESGNKHPLIAVVSSYMDLSPGDKHLRTLSESVKKGIIQSGGTPIEIVIPGFCGELKRNSYVRRYYFAYRDFAAAMVEFLLAFHDFEGAVFLCTCDNQVPAFTMGALRVNLPSVFLTGGYMSPGEYSGIPITAFSVAKGYGRYTAGQITKQQLDEMVACACPSCGACPELGTANTMCIITETLGLSPTGCSTTRAESIEQILLAEETGQLVMKCVRDNIRPLDIVTKESLENAIRVCIAIGGSTNAIVHTIAYSKEAELEISLDTWDRLSNETPLVLAISPNQSGYYISDLDKNGGILVVMKTLEPILNTNCLRVDGRRLTEVLNEVEPIYSNILRPLEDPFSPNGGLMILKGNLASKGGVLKTSSIPPQLRWFKGKARVYNCEEDAMTGVLCGEVEKGEVLVIRYEGPAGGCGSREMVSIMHLLTGKGWQNDVAIITDGRISGTNLGLAICNICPEAIKGNALSIVETGDIIEIDLEKKSVDIIVSDEIIIERLNIWQRPEKKVKKGVLSLYADVVTSLSEGARII